MIVARGAAGGAPRRAAARPCSALLVLAGLMRPEAWVLAGLYFLWMWPAADTPAPAAARRDGRRGAAALGAVATCSSPATRCTPCTARPTSPRPSTAAATSLDAPYWTAQYYGYTLREPLVIGIPIGLCFAWRHRRREAILPLVVVAAMTLVFMVGPIFGLPLIGRYVRTPSVLLTPFYGLAGAGLLLLADAAARRRWTLIGIATAALSVAFLPWHVGMLADLERRLDRDGRMYEELRAAARAPAVRDAVARCGGRISASDYRPLPHLRYWLGTDPGTRRDDAPGRQPARRRAAPAAPRPADAALLPGELPADRDAAGLPRDLPQRRVARARRAGLRHTSSSVTASWSTSRKSV